ncbi:MAG: urea ABC transporter permease subunit UrtC [Bryobacteraceae bacterium]
MRRIQAEAILVSILLLLLIFGAPHLLSEFRLNLLSKFLSLAVLALGLDLIWGYTGILSLGHGVFFGLGGYCMAMYLKLQASGTDLPDFMMWNGLSEVPAVWKPMQSFPLAMSCAILIPASVGTVVAYLTFRSRIQGVYFSILTQALALVVSLLLIGQQPYTGGTNGITDFKSILRWSLSETSTQHGLYFATVIVLALSYVLCRWITRGRFGRTLAAIRDAENRMRYLGYNPVRYKVFVFAVSCALAGVAGALYVPQVGIISPANVGIVPSIEMVIWVAVGGRGTLAGAVLGAVLVNAAKSVFSENLPNLWLYAYGLLFVGTVLFFPGGLVGLMKKIRRKPAPIEADPSMPEHAPEAGAAQEAAR